MSILFQATIRFSRLNQKNDFFPTKPEKGRVERQRRDVTVDQDRLDPFFIHRSQDGAAFSKPALGTEDEERMVHPASDQPHMMSE